MRWFLAAVSGFPKAVEAQRRRVLRVFLAMKPLLTHMYGADVVQNRVGRSGIARHIMVVRLTMSDDPKTDLHLGKLEGGIDPRSSAMKDYRKLLAYIVSVASIMLMALIGPKIGLTDGGLDTAVYGIVGALMCFMGGNGIEHWTKKPPAKGE